MNPDYSCLEDSLAELEDMGWQSLDVDFDDEIPTEEGRNVVEE